MQNKGLITSFAIVLALICLYQLSFTWIGKSVEKDAREYAKGNEAKERYYLDSISDQPVFDLGFYEVRYKRAKNEELNLGLDLKGGINVTLQVSVKDILKSLTNYSDNPVFKEALSEASRLQKSSSEDYLKLFFQEFKRINQEKGSLYFLSSPDIFGTKDFSESIGANTEDKVVQAAIEKKVHDAVSNAFTVLRARIDKFGVTQPNIQRIGSSGRILVELPGVKDVDRVKRLLVSTAQLEFWEVYNLQDIDSYIFEGENRIKSIIQAQESQKENKKELKTDTVKVKEGDQDLKNLLAKAQKNDSISDLDAGPVRKAIDEFGYPAGAVLFYSKTQDTAKINRYFRMRQFREAFPAEFRFTKFLWGVEQKNKTGYLPLYAIKSNRKDLAPLSGYVITNAKQDYDQYSSQPVVRMQMNSEGARIWEKMTGKAYTNKTSIAIALDDIVYSAPGVTTGAISGGNSQISGNFSIEEASDLATKLNAGKLPAPTRIIQAEIVGPSLGHESISSGIKSFAIALLVVLLWMIFYYSIGGAFADFALITNLFFIFGVLASFHAVLTLPGIAGIVLTIGMSVDANVLIFERIKEELNKGKVIKQAIKDGYKYAYSAILDANITTMFTGIILYVFGSGPIRGFATTLMIGILTSLFCAIFITRLLIDFRLTRGKSVLFFTGMTKNLFENWSISFLDRRKMAYIVSGTLILISLVSFFTRGLNQGVDFVGGRTYTVRFSEPVSTEDMAQSLGAVFVNEEGHSLVPEVKTFGTNNQVKITTKYKINSDEPETDYEVESLLFQGVQSFLPDGVTKESFIKQDENKTVGVMSSIKVGPTIADDIKQGAFYAILGSLLVVFLYILARFRKWQFSVGAVIAVFHDVIIVLGIFSLFYGKLGFSLEIDQAFIAAILTVIGYSLNDTVVVFDRIREFMGEYTSMSFNKLVNKALNSTLSRTINTSLTTFFVLLVIFVFGGATIKGFMFALMIGVIVGTYSSLFIATPSMFDLSNKYIKNLKDKKVALKKDLA